MSFTTIKMSFGGSEMSFGYQKMSFLVFKAAATQMFTFFCGFTFANQGKNPAKMSFKVG